ncbi:hypothetical protein M501DRAFT_924055, partial [Patellaria atrata CBS 101060]
PTYTPTPLPPPSLSQKLLTTFSTAFLVSNSPNFNSTLQAIKSDLYNRNFNSAFGTEERRAAYAARWSAGRALGYLQVFRDVGEYISETLESRLLNEEAQNELRAICLGGGAGAEVAALAGCGELESLEITSSTPPTLVPSELTLSLTAVDLADWSSTLQLLTSNLTHNLFRHCSHPPLTTKFLQHNLLQPLPTPISDTIQHIHLVTLLFTLNELYTASLPQTQRFLFSLTELARPGTLFLVVDSAGSYSEISLGKGQKRKYPMAWLLDHTLLRKEDDDADGHGNAEWEKLESVGSRWFRLPAGLKYSIELENMRYQLHLYRR